MRCSDFLQVYSDYRDGLMGDPDLKLQVGDHLATCRRCMDYDAYISRGVMLLKATAAGEPTGGFKRRLEQRLSEECAASKSGSGVRKIHAGIMTVLMMAAGIAMAARTDPAPDAQIPSPREVSVSAPPFVARASDGAVDLTDWSVPAFSREVAQPQPQVSFATWVSLGR